MFVSRFWPILRPILNLADVANVFVTNPISQNVASDASSFAFHLRRLVIIVSALVSMGWPSLQVSCEFPQDVQREI